MEVGAHVWLRSSSSQWGWVPAIISDREDITVKSDNKYGGAVNKAMVKLTLRDDCGNYHGGGRSNEGNDNGNSNNYFDDGFATPTMSRRYDDIHGDNYFHDVQPFTAQITVDPTSLKAADHPDIKLRNLPASYQFSGQDPEAAVVASPSTKIDSSVVGGVHDLIGLTHLHEPAILHALRLRYDADIIYTSTGPILIAVNPFKKMDYLYSEEVMEEYRIQGEHAKSSGGSGAGIASKTPFKQTKATLGRLGKQHDLEDKLPPHAYKTADEAYRAMMRGIENSMLMTRGGARSRRSSTGGLADLPTNQSILVSGESGAGKTVTTKIVLNYFAMLSKRIQEEESRKRRESNYSPACSPMKNNSGRRQLSPMMTSCPPDNDEDQVCIEQQVLQSNPILEAFGNARTLRNDNSSRFGKYIDIQFTSQGKLSGAKIETYLLEKVRLIHPGKGERNYHVFYQFLASATKEERREYMIQNMGLQDFRLLSQTETYARRDGVKDGTMHHEMLDAMITIGFDVPTIKSIMRLIVAILHAGNMTFTPTSHGHSDACILDKTPSAIAAAKLLGVSFEDLASALTFRAIRAGNEVVHSPMDITQSKKACEALMKATYGAAFDYIVTKVNESISNQQSQVSQSKHASIGVLDIFGFETFEVNNFEQICINYTNEALQQQFNKYVFKLEQDEYEREGILWKFISFPDNQDVLDLIDRKHTGILALLDEQCIVPKSTDEKFTRYLYAKCDKHTRFSASAAQRVDYKFSIEHYAGPVEYSTDSWLEKNKDQLPAASANLLKHSSFGLLSKLQTFVRSEDRDGRGSVATKSVGAQFSAQLRELRARIDTTVPHYIRCLKPNDELVPEHFDPKMIVDQLRCGGVLEAVRVSRAGYPTRYPHDVFKARYYILGDPKDRTPMSPYGNKQRFSMSQEDVAVKRLVSKIAFDIWEADHKAMMMALHDENGTPIAKRSSKSYSNTNYVNGHPSLAAVCRASTPDELQKQKAKAKKARESEAFNTNGIARPETAKEFLSLDFSSRCAIAGLQLGRTKVFLRREAFDRIEKLRAQKFGKSATAIQKMVRGMQARAYCEMRRYCVFVIQNAARNMLARMHRQHMQDMQIAAIIIQRCYREHLNHLFYLELNNRLNPAATMIQAVARGANTRMWYFGTLYSIMRLQALVRGCLARAHVARLAAERHQPVASPIQSFDLRPSFEASVSPVARPDETQIVPKEECQAVAEVASEWSQLQKLVNEENWAAVESTLDKHPHLAEEVDPTSGEMLLHMIARHPNIWTLLVDMVLVLYPKALIHKDAIGALPLHHAAAHDNIAALEIIYSAYKEGVNDVDESGREPIHVAAEFDAAEAVKFLLAKAPEGAYTMIHRPNDESGGGLPLHVACRHHSSMTIITSLLAENFASAKRTDENGDLPLHLLLRNGEAVEQVTVKTLLTCFAQAVSRTDKNGDLPLSIAIKHECKPAVVNYLLVQYPEAAKLLDGSGHSNLHLAFQHGADDRTMLGLLNHAPELATMVDKESGLLPIQVATEHEHSHFIVHHLLKQDLPIDIKEKVTAKVENHHYSWNHVVSNTDDMYYPVVNKILQQCTQPQVLALAHVEGPDGRIALSTATPVCKYEMRVMLRLFNTLEVVNQRPAFSNPLSDTQIFYALRYDPPKHDNGQWSLIHEDNKKDGDYFDEWDDSSHVSGLSRMSSHSNHSLSSKCSQVGIEEKLKQIKKEKGQQVIAKLTSRSDVVERELKIRKDYHLSRHYVPAVISVHHTVQHAAYSEAMAEPGYCITMEGADTTAENLMLDMRKYGKSFSTKILKRIGISLLHMHEHGLVHGDFGTHNVGKFGSRWKLLGVGGSKPIGSPSDPQRGFYHAPESVVVESKRAPLGKKEVVAKVVSIESKPSQDIWAFGVLMYEAICGMPLSPYACRGKRPMSANEISKVKNFNEESLERALRHVNQSDYKAIDILKNLLQQDPNKRCSLREALEHPFFDGTPDDRVLPSKESRGDRSIYSSSTQQTRPATSSTRNSSAKNGSISEGLKFIDQENNPNGSAPRRAARKNRDAMSVASHNTHASTKSAKLALRGLKDRMRAGFNSRKHGV